MIFLKTENPFLETKFLQIFECLQTRIQKFYNLLQHEKSYSSSQPFFLKKKCCPIFGCILLVICEITLTLRHDAIFFEKISSIQQLKTEKKELFSSSTFWRRDFLKKRLWPWKKCDKWLFLANERWSCIYLHIAEIHGGSI